MARTTVDFVKQLAPLLKLYGVQPSYVDVGKKKRHASVESLLAVLRSLGVDIDRPEQARELLEKSRDDAESVRVEPVIVAWDGDAVEVSIEMTSKRADAPLECHLYLDDGSESSPCEIGRPSKAPAGSRRRRGSAVRRISLPQNLRSGYHRLVVAAAGQAPLESLVISAPSRAFSPAADERTGDGQPATHTAADRHWGSFAPLYSLRSDRNWGAGDFTDLANLMQWTGSRGGDIVGTLPLLAAYLDEPFDASPYAPASRQFWNEFYIDVAAIPELSRRPEARELVASQGFADEIQALRNDDHVDYRRLMALKRSVLLLLADDFFENESSRFGDYQQFLRSHANVEDYARFRAVFQARGEPWPSWPAWMRDGAVAESDFNRRDMQYHLYCQWIAAEQIQSLHRRAKELNCGLYLDLPLGVRPDSYDVWRHQSSYATGATAGAPPDAVFTKGQDWGFPPLHPHGIRKDGYRHVRQFLAHHLQFARELRIDHAMGLHRLYWIPSSLPADQGVYVQYPFDELYAVLSVESHRHRATIVGEDLGTVPAEVGREMERRHIRRMYVVQYEVESNVKEVLSEIPAQSVASLNTHDMPTFSAWYRGDDIPDRRDLGLLDESGELRQERRRRRLRKKLTDQLRAHGFLSDADALVPKKSGKRTRAASNDADTAAVMRALIRLLAASPAEVLLINLEDLWLEARPQNTPGTVAERVNWRRKLRYSVDEFVKMPEVVEALEAVDELRRGTAAALDASDAAPRQTS